jgi:hypothetical protein
MESFDLNSATLLFDEETGEVTYGHIETCDSFRPDDLDSED